MVKNPGTKLGFLTAGAFEQGIIHEKDICAFFIGKILQIPVYDTGCKERCKTEPVCSCGIQETVEGILGEVLPECPGLLLHIHAPILKNNAKLISKERNGWKSLFLCTITPGQKFSDMVSGKKSLDTIK